MAYFKLYKASDDSVVSTTGVFTNAVEFTLRADQNEISTPVKLYIKAESGYTVDTVEVTPTGTTAAKWQLATDNSNAPGTWSLYGAKVELGSGLTGAGKKEFWVRAKATDDEDPVIDTTVLLECEGIVKASS